MLSLGEKPVILFIKAWFKDVKNTRSYLLTVFALSITVILVFSENINKYITITSMKHFSLQSWLLHENKISMLRDLIKPWWGRELFTYHHNDFDQEPSACIDSGQREVSKLCKWGRNSVTNLILFLLVRSII